MSRRTWGDMVPRFRELPGYEAIAASPYVPGEGPPGAVAVADPDPTESPGFDGARHRELRLLVLGCDYRGGPLLCGCTRTRICLMGKGRPVPGTDATDVTDEDCLACVKG